LACHGPQRPVGAARVVSSSQPEFITETAPARTSELHDGVAKLVNYQYIKASNNIEEQERYCADSAAEVCPPGFAVEAEGACQYMQVELPACVSDHDRWFNLIRGPRERQFQNVLHCETEESWHCKQTLESE
jgi:hypothetical protein